MSKKRKIPQEIQCLTVRELIVALMAMPNIDVQVKTSRNNGFEDLWAPPSVRHDGMTGQVLIL